MEGGLGGVLFAAEADILMGLLAAAYAIVEMIGLSWISLVVVELRLGDERRMRLGAGPITSTFA